VGEEEESGHALKLQFLRFGFVLWVAGGAFDVGGDVASEDAEVDLCGVELLVQVLVQFVREHPDVVIGVDAEVVGQGEFVVVLVEGAAEALVVRLVRVPAADGVLGHQVVQQDAVLGHGGRRRLRQLTTATLRKNLTTIFLSSRITFADSQKS